MSVEMPKKDKTLLVRMTAQQWETLKAYAEAEDCSMASVVRKLLRSLPEVNPPC